MSNETNIQKRKQCEEGEGNERGMKLFLTIFTANPFWQDIGAPEILDGRGDFYLGACVIPEFIEVCVPLRDCYIDEVG